MQHFESSFDNSAQDYHYARPGYPETMYNDIARLCGLGPSTRVLEIGAGSGIATKQLARFGCDIVAIEPGERLIAIAEQHLADCPNVELVSTTFEDFTSERPFDILIAATAFHWLDPATRYEKSDGLLNDGGFLVLVWNSFYQGTSAAASEIRQAYGDFITPPDADSSPNERILAKLAVREQEITASERFSIVYFNHYETSHQNDSRTNLALVKSFPDVANAPASLRESFLTRISQIVDKYHSITVPVLTSLYVCGKTGRISESK